MKTKKKTAIDIPETTARQTKKVTVRPILNAADRQALVLQKEAEASAKRDANRARLFSILETVAELKRMGINTVYADFVDQVDEEYLFGGIGLATCGIRVNYTHYDEGAKNPRRNTLRDLHVHTEDWEFDVLAEQFQFAKDEHAREVAEKEAKDAVIRKLSPEDRKALGFENWKDPKKVL